MIDRGWFNTVLIRNSENSSPSPSASIQIEEEESDVPEFERFQPEHPTITISKTSRLSLNNASREALGDATFIEPLFDPKRRILGLRPCAATTPGGFNVRNGVIQMSSFFSFYKIDIDKSRRWTARLYFEKILGCCLNDDPEWENDE